MGNEKFKNAIAGIAQKVPPIWFMRQAGRYHQHYQKLRARYDFMQLCKEPELAAEVALGPIRDFDFDAAILFSDLLFPLEALGMGLKYEPGPILDRQLCLQDLKNLQPLPAAKKFLQFQKKSLQMTREMLPKNKSLIGFIGGPWTLFSYAVGGGHDGSLIAAKNQMEFFNHFSEIMLPLLIENIQLQIEGGADIIMIFDTAAGELSPQMFNSHVAEGLNSLAKKYPKRLGYYSKGTHNFHLSEKIFANQSWAGFGVDHRWDISQALQTRQHGFLQGNFDQALLFSNPDEFADKLREWLKPIKDLPPQKRCGWICGLGHGVLPKTPESNVRSFVHIVREEMSL